MDIWTLLYFLFPFYSIGLLVCFRKIKENLDRKQLERCTGRVTGRCVQRYQAYKYMSMNYSKGNHIFYYNIWEYHFHGRVLQSKTKLETRDLWANVGDEALLGVNPDKPNEIVMIQADNQFKNKAFVKTCILTIICWVLFGIVMVNGGLS